MEPTQKEQQIVKGIFKSENTLGDLWDNIKWNNIHIIPEGKETEKGPEKLFEKKKAWLNVFLYGEGNKHPGPGNQEFQMRWTQRDSH